jgi:ATP-dependent Clp protease adaptor protein ClpS
MQPLPHVAPGLLEETETRLAPMYHVVLLDDQEHTYEYVIEMISKIFRKSADAALRHAFEVDATGRTILETTWLERAELKRDQVKGYGGDWRLPSRTSMQALIEKADL